MNIITVTGHLGKDCELQTTQSGMSIFKNSIAVKRRFKNKQTNEYETDWLNITAFNKTAEMMSKWLSKGSKVFISGETQTRNYTDNNTGAERKGYEIIVNQFEKLDYRNGSQDKSDNYQFQPAQDQAKQQRQSNNYQNANNQAEPVDISRESLPF